MVFLLLMSENETPSGMLEPLQPQIGSFTTSLDYSSLQCKWLTGMQSGFARCHWDHLLLDAQRWLVCG